LASLGLSEGNAKAVFQYCGLRHRAKVVVNPMKYRRKGSEIRNEAEHFDGRNYEGKFESDQSSYSRVRNRL
jgi:hypothetical protein